MADVNACSVLRVQCIKWHKPQPKYFNYGNDLSTAKTFEWEQRVCSDYFVHGNPMVEHPHPELWLRRYGTNRETHNHNGSIIIESVWNDIDEQSDVFISTRIGAIKRKQHILRQVLPNPKNLKFSLRYWLTESAELVWKNLVIKLDCAWSVERKLWTYLRKWKNQKMKMNSNKSL